MSFDSPSCGQWCRRLYEQKASELVLYGRALGLSHTEAEDVLQDTFIALMRLEERPARPEHYCVRTYRNRALNLKRGWWTRLRAELESKRWFERGSDETESERRAMRALAQLPADQREVIVLKFWHRHTFEEIGALLEISPNTAAGRYRYGIQKLKLQFEANEHERAELDRGTDAFLDAAASFAGN